MSPLKFRFEGLRKGRRTLRSGKMASACQGAGQARGHSGCPPKRRHFNVLYKTQGRKAPLWGQPLTCLESERKPPGAPRGHCHWSACRSWGQRKGRYRGHSPGMYPPLPVRPHFSARVTTGLLSWEACSQCVPQSDAPTSSAHLS